MGHYLDGQLGRVHVQLYKNKAMGISFPTNGDKHNDDWEKHVHKFKMHGQANDIKVIIHHYEDDSIIAIEIEGLTTINGISLESI